ncbi:MAG TPA: nuclear transport factor 2 family protein [Opitutaceae bacterium]|nr:nuclear transport factor 2 family protein [Opitutaceae bacterium]
MKRVISTAVLAIAVTSLASVQLSAAAQKPASGGDEQVITQLEQDWGVALAKNDQAWIDGVVSPEWMLTGADGVLMTKAETDAEMKAGAMKFESFHLDSLMVHVDGGTAVAFGLETEKSSYKGEDTSGQYRFTDVFVKRNGTWKAIATQVTKVAKH